MMARTRSRFCRLVGVGLVIGKFGACELAKFKVAMLVQFEGTVKVFTPVTVTVKVPLIAVLKVPPVIPEMVMLLPVVSP